ncbi:Low-density lipoprotein receptor-related protein 4, partial [Geodia barretti]
MKSVISSSTRLLVLMAVICRLPKNGGAACYLAYEFTCDNDLCVAESSQCDGVDDCGDNSDEENCSTTGFP